MYSDFTQVTRMLSKLPPKIILSPYWELFSMLSSLIPEDEGFTVSQLKEVLLNRMKDLYSDNPLVFRMYQLLLNDLEHIINALLRASVLFEEEGFLFKSKSFSRVYHLLKNIRKSVLNFIALVIWYLYNRGLCIFSTEELLKYVSYTDSEYIRELPHLYVRVFNTFYKLLEKHENLWLFKEGFYPSKRPILLQDLHERLISVLYRIYKFKKEFSEKELLGILRSLELKSIRRAVKRLGLRYDEGKCYVNDSDIKRIEKLLFEKPLLSFHWPSFGTLYTSNPFFKIEGDLHNAYVDMPNSIIISFIEHLDVLSRKYQHDLETLYKETIKLKNKFNELFRKYGDWYTIQIRREVFGKRPFGVRVKIDWIKFQEFIDNFASNDVPLERKYEYILICRAEAVWMRRALDQRLSERVKEIARSDINYIVNEIDAFIEELWAFRKKLRSKLLIRKKLQPLLLAYLPELISTFRIIRNCVNEGALPICYREMRKSLESISWVIIDDILSFRNYPKYAPLFTSPLRIPNKEWYSWARRENRMIRSIGELKNALQPIIKEIRDKYVLKKKDIECALFESMSYPLFLTLLGIGTSQYENGYIPCYDVEKLRPFIEENIRDVLISLRVKPDVEFVEHLVECIIRDKHYIVIPYPSVSFVIQLLEKFSRFKLMKLYEAYSYFVHSYCASWQFYPFSSVLEFKIFKYELIKFIQVILRLLGFYREALLKSTR